MGQLEVYEFPDTGQQIRTILRGDDPWFVAVDVAAALGIANARDAVSRLDESEKGVGETDTPGGRQRVTVISEAGLYRLVMRSNRPDAVRFQMWIAHEVLPAIRRTGGYTVPARQLPRTFAEALELAARQAREIESQTAELAAIAPQAEAWEMLASADGDYSAREAAQILSRDPNIDIGRNRLLALLRDWRLVDRQDQPYQAHIQHVRLRATSYTDRWDVEHVDTQVRITVAGLRYLHRRLGGVRQLRFQQSAA